MKPKYAFIFALNLLVSFCLAGLVVVLFSKEQEKERFIQDLQEQQKVDRQKAVKAREAVEEQKQFEDQIKLETQKQLAAKKIRLINDDLDKIDVRLKQVLDAPSGYADETKAQRDTQEELLRQLGNAARAEIGVLAVDMQNAGFANDKALQGNLDAFFKNYEDKIHAERLSYDFIDLGFTDSDRKKELDAESAQALQAAFTAKRAIHNLKLAAK